MPLSELKKLPAAKVRRIAHDLNIMIPRDFTKTDLVDAISERQDEDQVAWRLLDQYK